MHRMSTKFGADSSAVFLYSAHKRTQTHRKVIDITDHRTDASATAHVDKNVVALRWCNSEAGCQAHVIMKIEASMLAFAVNRYEPIAVSQTYKLISL